jgi:hypothetical protein
VRHVLPPTALDGVALPALPAPKEE